MAMPIGFVRCMLFIFNVVFALSGIAILVMSVLIYKDVKAYSAVGDFLEARFTAPLITLMVVGSLVILVAVLGVIGAFKEIQAVIMTFAVLLFIIYVIEVVIATIAFLRSNDIGSGVKDNMVESFSKYINDPVIYNTYNAMQSDLDCCGVIGPQDYLFIFPNNSVPTSCCYFDNAGQMCKQTVDAHIVHQTGCYEAVRQFVTRSGITLGSVTISLAFIEVVGIVFSVILVISLQKEARYMGISLEQGSKFRADPLHYEDEGKELTTLGRNSDVNEINTLGKQYEDRELDLTERQPT